MSSQGTCFPRSRLLFSHNLQVSALELPNPPSSSPLVVPSSAAFPLRSPVLPSASTVERLTKPSFFVTSSRASLQHLVLGYNSPGPPTAVTGSMVAATGSVLVLLRFCRNILHVHSPWTLSQSSPPHRLPPLPSSRNGLIDGNDLWFWPRLSYIEKETLLQKQKISKISWAFYPWDIKKNMKTIKPHNPRLLSWSRSLPISLCFCFCLGRDEGKERRSLLAVYEVKERRSLLAVYDYCSTLSPLHQSRTTPLSFFSFLPPPPSPLPSIRRPPTISLPHP